MPTIPDIDQALSINPASGIGLLVETAKPGAVFGQVVVVNFGTPFWSLSVATNILATLLIAGRLLHRRQLLRDAAKRHMYTSAVAIFVESAALYAICAIVYIPMFAKNIPLQFPFSALLGSASVCLKVSSKFNITDMESTC